MPQGLETLVHGNGANLTRSQVLRVLLARMIVTRPELLIFNGSLHNIESALRLHPATPTLFERRTLVGEIAQRSEVSQLVERRWC